MPDTQTAIDEEADQWAEERLEDLRAPPGRGGGCWHHSRLRCSACC